MTADQARILAEQENQDGDPHVAIALYALAGAIAAGTTEDLSAYLVTFAKAQINDLQDK